VVVSGKLRAARAKSMKFTVSNLYSVTISIHSIVKSPILINL
jgi:hypothetical protein